MAKRPTVILDLQTIQKQTAGLTSCKYGAYMAAVMHQWEHGSLPADLSEVVEIMRIRDVDPSGTALALLRRFFTQRTDGTWVNLATQAVRTETRSVSRSYAARSMKGNQKRWANHTPKRPTKNPAYVRPSGTASGSPVLKASSANPSLPSQAQGVSPLAIVPAGRGERSATLRAPLPKAAKRSGHRKRPVARPADPQMVLTPTEAPAARPAPVSAPASTPSPRPSNSINPPQDPRFDQIANEIRTNYWPALNRGIPCPWSQRAKAGLSRFLAASPDLAFDQVRHMLGNRFDSVRRGLVNASQPVEEWVERLHNWAAGPANDFGTPLRHVAHK